MPRCYGNHNYFWHHKPVFNLGLCWKGLSITEPTLSSPHGSLQASVGLESRLGQASLTIPSAISGHQETAGKPPRRSHFAFLVENFRGGVRSSELPADPTDRERSCRLIRRSWRCLRVPTLHYVPEHSSATPPLVLGLID